MKLFDRNHHFKEPSRKPSRKMAHLSINGKLAERMFIKSDVCINSLFSLA